MIAVKDPEYNECLYGRSGADALCAGCGYPADYLSRTFADEDWAAAQPWCLSCRPRRGRPPHHGERVVRAWIFQATCTRCSAAATRAITDPGDPPLSVLRRGKAAADLADIMSRATGYCEEHVPIQTLGAQAAAAAHPYADPDQLRRALEHPAATSYGAVARLLAVKDGGTTTKALLRNHAMHLAADPTFPPLPQPRTPAEWGALAWSDRREAGATT